MGSVTRRLTVSLLSLGWLLGSVSLGTSAGLSQERSNPVDETVECELLIVGGGLAGTATAYESLLAGRTVCMTELTDWVGGQISSQGTTALDEAKQQRNLLFYSRGYKELRDRVEAKYGELNPGGCWVSVSCFLPYDANSILMEMLHEAERKGKGELRWFPNTVVKELELNGAGNQIDRVIGIQHKAAPGTAPLNSDRLSEIIEDVYRYDDSARLVKTAIEFVPLVMEESSGPADWYVIEATETGELIALADIPYQLGLDPRSPLDPSSPVTERDPYCTQGFTYTFAMERVEDAQTYDIPDFYATYEPYFSWERAVNHLNTAEDYFNRVFRYRRIWDAIPRSNANLTSVGDISMQNWTWGNDYRPGTARDNLIYTRDQLQSSGQLQPGGWMGGLRTETLHKGEENAIAYFYWLVSGNEDSQIDDKWKEPNPYYLYLQGLDSPMGTASGLSKYPYIREGRRIIGRPSYGHPDGFLVRELDFSWNDFSSDYYQTELDGKTYKLMRQFLAGQWTPELFESPANEIPIRGRSRIYPDTVGIAQYAIDFHPCMRDFPAEKTGNIEYPGVRQAHGQAYPAQIPLRAMIPQKLDNLLVASKSIATSTIAAAAYRVHSFEWSVGAAAGHTIDFALRNQVMPYELVDDLPNKEPMLDALRQEIQTSGNPIMFPNTSIFNEDWNDWKVW
ncbi:FAD-dependent oxidoreductase [Roseofilum casamattae]|uniref:FAD-dependent oxidoreductase n=1 Tax=Roseofilum casamattae BLCC-M143 TaxID=3022442 RepID=A0ABT7BX20_9CYAN|nr:FAD-dependent oxidoreductase [Roseofilum casamattae]MDJ1182828.1 FAD-dependent oxidoreductase [Roseofilum casamattae BLCC-M143]